MNKDYVFLPHELEHLNFLKENAHECALFLKRDDDSFPLDSTCDITLIGNGVRHTVIGGTGSGAVNVRYLETIEQAFENAGFKILSKDWLDKYDADKAAKKSAFIKSIKKEAREHHAMAASYSFGRSMYESDYEFPIFGNHEVAIYVLSRNAGEGSDRKLIPGDIYLTKSEIRDILILNRTYKKFLLVLNTPSVIDLTPVLEVKNILLISQLGSMTGDILANIVLGNVNPSGKLTDTWAKISDYPYIDSEIDENECLYKEGIYVGYRYFTSKNIEPLFPFGFGLSYTHFDVSISSYDVKGDKVTLKVNVTNKGKYSGKEVVQAYVSGPTNRAALELVAFKKSKLLKPKENEIVELSFALSDFPSYSEAQSSYYLDKGDYVVKAGNSSSNVKPVLVFADLVIDRVLEKHHNLPTFELSKENFSSTAVSYKETYHVDVPEYIKSLSADELIHMCLCDYKECVDGLIGQSCSLVPGGAGETTLRVKSLNEAVSMVDGPAGLRLVQEFIVNSKGVFPTTEESIWKSVKDYVPSFITYFLSPERNKNKKGSKVLQIATAIPIATALAQSFNEDFVYGCGRLVKQEMEMYNVDVWLAPGVNIHRHILCGRNFEYYSEDPFVASICASNIIKAIQEDGTKSTTIKHFACNNQETNRTNNNSIVSERAAREIYLVPFEKAIKLSNPFSIMASYNLVNGIHASEHRGLLIDILRNEWNYKGLIMTDWIASGQTYRKNNKYPNSYASRNLKNGTNICMPGNKKDIKDIKRALKRGYISRDDLEQAATMVFNFIKDRK